MTSNANAHHGESWPYHEDPHGRMVPCASNPCGRHDSSEHEMATSPEEAYAMKHADNASTGMTANKAGRNDLRSWMPTNAASGLPRTDDGMLTDKSAITIINRIMNDADNGINAIKLNPDDYEDIRRNHANITKTLHGIYGDYLDNRLDDAVGRFMRDDVQSIITSNANAKDWRRVPFGNADIDGIMYAVPSKSSDGSDDEMGVLVKADRNGVSFTVHHRDGKGGWRQDGNRMISENTDEYGMDKGLGYDRMRHAVDADVNAYAYIADIPREPDGIRVADDAAKLSKMVDGNSDWLEPDDGMSAEDSVREAYREKLRGQHGYMETADDGRWYVFDDSSMGVYWLSSTTRRDGYGNPLPIALNDYDLKEDECELLSINNQRNDEDSIIYHLPDNRMSSIMHDGQLRKAVFRKLVAMQEVEYEDYTDDNAVNEERNDRTEI